MRLSRLISSVLGCSILLASSSYVFAESDPKLWPVMKEAFFEKRPMTEVDFIKIERRAVPKVVHKCLLLIR